LFKQYALHSLINDLLLTKIKNCTKSAVDHKLTEGIIFSYHAIPNSLRQHKRSTRNCGGIKGKNNKRRNFQDRLGHCLAVEGKHFEHFL
jgi:hypothetical protein